MLTGIWLSERASRWKGRRERRLSAWPRAGIHGAVKWRVRLGTSGLHTLRSTPRRTDPDCSNALARAAGLLRCVQEGIELQSWVQCGYGSPPYTSCELRTFAEVNQIDRTVYIARLDQSSAE